MTLETTLIEAGFDKKAAKKLADDEYFRIRYSNKSSEEILERINLIAAVYDIDTDSVRDAITEHPQFAGYGHQCKVDEIRDVYGWRKEDIKKVVFKFPPFAGYGHQCKVDEIRDVYGWSKEDIKKVVFEHPQFAGSDHQRKFDEIRDVYGWSKEDIKKVVFKYPQFAWRDHHQVMRKLSRIGRIVGLDEDTVKEEVMERPVLAGYSAKRYLAMIDVVMHLRTEGELSDSRAVDLCRSYFSKSPYVPGNYRLRVTQALKRGNYYEDPPLMVTLRKSMRDSEEKNERRRLVA